MEPFARTRKVRRISSRYESVAHRQDEDTSRGSPHVQARRRQDNRVRIMSPADAAHDAKRYARALRCGWDDIATAIEKEWGLHGYTPEIVSTVLSCVATGLDLETAIREATAS